MKRAAAVVSLIALAFVSPPTARAYLKLGFDLNGRRYGHILDIRTGQPVDNGCRAVSVLAASHALAGRTDEARRAGELLRQLASTLRVSMLKDL